MSTVKSFNETCPFSKKQIIFNLDDRSCFTTTLSNGAELKGFATTDDSQGDCRQTQNGNFLVSHREGYFYSKPNGQFIRWANSSEWEWAQYWESPLLPVHKDFQFTGIVLPIRISRSDYQYCRETISEDYSNYQEGSSSNGGNYGVWTNRHVILYNSKKYVFETEHTTADFDYDQLSGNFQSNGIGSLMVGFKEENKLFIFEGISIYTEQRNADEYDTYLISEEKL